MFRTWKTGAVLAGAALLVVAALGPAAAQGRRGGGRGFGQNQGFGLLRNKSVQAELKMTQPQIEKVDAKQQELQQQMRDLFQSSQGDPNAMQANRAKMQEMQNKAVADILDTTQQKRFKQIEYQQMGAQAFTRPDVADALKLTEDQRAKIRSIEQESFQQMREAMQGVDRQNMTDADRQKLASLRKATDDKVVAVLTDAQKAQWKQMQGAPFKLVPNNAA